MNKEKNRASSCLGIWMFPKIVGFPPNHPFLIVFSIIFTIHFGGNTPIFGNTHIGIEKLHSYNGEYFINHGIFGSRH